MTDHFRAFSFVDRILEVDPGVSVVGEYLIPPGIDEFPMALVAESLGQCAAWSAMDAVSFKVRPVAGIVGRIDWVQDAKPGQTLRLSADIRRTDEEAVAYHGLVTVDGNEVIRIKNCLGPMVPMEEYDDPEAMRQRYELLRGTGAEPEAYKGVPPLLVERKGESDGAVLATLHVPESAPFFNDHFPRRPVLPGTLQMNAIFRFATEIASEKHPPANSVGWEPEGVAKVKIRAFTEPGELLDLKAEFMNVTDESATVSVEATNDDRLISSVRIMLRAAE